MRGTLSGPLERLPREDVDCHGEVIHVKCGSHIRSVGIWLRREDVAGPSLQFDFVSPALATGLSDQALWQGGRA